MLTLFIPNSGYAQKILCGNSPKGIILHYQGPLSFKQIELFADGLSIARLQRKTEPKAIRKAYEKGLDLFPDYIRLSDVQLKQIADSMQRIKNTESLPMGYYLTSKLASGLAAVYEKGSALTVYTAKMDGVEIAVEWEQKQTNLPDNTLSPFKYKSGSGHIQTSWIVKPKTAALFTRLFRKPHEATVYLPVDDAVIRSVAGDGDTILVVAQDTSLPKLSYYHYSLTAYDFYGNASSPSLPMLADNLDNSTMPVVLKFIAEENSKTGRMEIRYKVDFAERVKSMVLQRSNFKDRGFENIASLGSKDTLYSDDAVNPMEAVYYRLVINDIKAPRFNTPVVPAVSHARPDVFPPQRPLVEWNGKYPVVSWAISDSSARGYKVYRTDDIGASPTLVSPLVFFRKGQARYSWTDSSQAIRPGQTYHYAVAGQGKGYTESSLSGFSTLRIPEKELPQSPAAPYLNKLSNGHVSVIWTPNGGVRSEGRGSHIYRATQKSGKYTRISNEVLINTNQFTDTLANTGDSLYYAVTAINSDGLESVRSLPAGIFVGDALQAIPLLIVAENGTTNFRWPAGNSQIKRVELEFSPVDSDDIKVLKSENAETGSLSLSAAPEGKYRIRGIDAKGRRTSEGNWVSYP